MKNSCPLPPYSSLPKRSKPIRARKKAQVRIGKVSGKIRLSGQALEDLRNEVYERDQGRCQWAGCGKLLPLYGSVFTRAHLAHIVSRGAGGSDTAANTRILCPPHHLVDEHTKGLEG
jgi:hypothetical protein